MAVFWSDCRQYGHFDPAPRNFCIAGNRTEPHFWLGECFGDLASRQKDQQLKDF
jgi:hypothetical protein